MKKEKIKLNKINNRESEEFLWNLKVYHYQNYSFGTSAKIYVNLLFSSENGSNRFLQNIGTHLPN
jgi:hypothetical protein